ncbi:hypothetical protein ElyMa_003128200 [Elysia marginata]|uniref:FZ domain-containing protein n=1 Tax=Elysia marginata TaxID=1093978 RepID=A0AAV4IVP8_9GAST|nr:hypothetical protein ElyMa_003128200 [Elysia marginata]
MWLFSLKYILLLSMMYTWRSGYSQYVELTIHSFIGFSTFKVNRNVLSQFYECLCSDSSLSCDLKGSDSLDDLDKTEVAEIHIGDLPEDLYEPTFQCDFDLVSEDRLTCVKMPKNYLKLFKQYCSHRSDQACQTLAVSPISVESCKLRCITLAFKNELLLDGENSAEITEDECPEELPTTKTTRTTTTTSTTTVHTSESTPTELLSQKKNKEDNSDADSSLDLGLGISLPLIFIIAAALAVFYWREKIKHLVLPKQEARSSSTSEGGNDICQASDADRTGDEDASNCYLDMFETNNTDASLLPEASAHDKDGDDDGDGVYEDVQRPTAEPDFVYNDLVEESDFVYNDLVDTESTEAEYGNMSEVTEVKLDCDNMEATYNNCEAVYQTPVQRHNSS